MFVEASAFSDENVSTAFEELLNSICEAKLMEGYSLEQSKSCLKLHDPELDKQESGCCN